MSMGQIGQKKVGLRVRAYADIITSVGNPHGNQGMALKVSENLRRNDIRKA